MMWSVWVVNNVIDVQSQHPLTVMGLQDTLYLLLPSAYTYYACGFSGGEFFFQGSDLCANYVWCYSALLSFFVFQCNHSLPLWGVNYLEFLHCNPFGAYPLQAYIPSGIGS